MRNPPKKNVSFEQHVTLMSRLLNSSKDLLQGIDQQASKNIYYSCCHRNSWNNSSV